MITKHHMQVVGASRRVSQKPAFKAGLTLAIACVAVSPAGFAMSRAASVTESIADPSFETPVLPSGGYEYGHQNGPQTSSNGVDARAAGVTFSNGAGVQSNGSAWGFAPAPKGTQTAFLQSYGDQVPAVITETVTGLVPGQSYAIRFSCANRAGYAVNPVTVSYDGRTLGTFSPASTRWGKVTSHLFRTTASHGVVTFSVAKSSGDADVGIDDVTIIAVPAS